MKFLKTQRNYLIDRLVLNVFKLIRELSNQDKEGGLDNDQAQKNLLVIGELKGVINNIEIMFVQHINNEEPNVFLEKSLIKNLEIFTFNFPEYKEYFLMDKEN